MIQHSSYSQEVSLRTDVKLDIEFIDSNETVRLKCKDGCAWSELSFTLGVNQTQSVDYFGMANGELSLAENQEDNLFIFKILKQPPGFSLVGLKGSNWEQLSFSCEGSVCNVLINQQGVSVSEK